MFVSSVLFTIIWYVTVSSPFADVTIIVITFSPSFILSAPIISIFASSNVDIAFTFSFSIVLSVNVVVYSYMFVLKLGVRFNPSMLNELNPKTFSVDSSIMFGFSSSVASFVTFIVYVFVEISSSANTFIFI